MSGRLLRKVLKQQDEALNNADPNHDQDSETEPDSPAAAGPSRNPFDLLDDGDADIGQEDEHVMAVNNIRKVEQEHPVTKKTSDIVTVSTRKSRKKKKKNKDESSSATFKVEESIDSVLADLSINTKSSFQQIDKVNTSRSDEVHPGTKKHMSTSVLQVDPKHLKAENELRKIFGSKVVNSFENNHGPGSSRQMHGGRRVAHNPRKTILVSPSNYWPRWDGSISMELLETKDGIHYFRYVHSASYQHAQQAFEAAKAINDLNAIASILAHYPYHIESLLTFAELFKFSGEHQSSADAISKCLFALECAWHPLFTPLQRNCQLKYSHDTNKPLFTAIFPTKNVDDEIYFDFRKQRFIFSKEKDTFCKLPYPTKESIGYYLKSTGHGTEAKVAAATDKWGRNVFEYPQPTFQKLMKEHCMEPFFVFQVFCVGLWCLDEFWYYSLFTLFMLFLFESTMAKSRLKTLTELRRVRVDSQTVMVHRGGKWVKLPGTDLLPGDVISIGRSSGQNGEDKSVPADMLLLAGSAIVNEAILTGESTPQWKTSIAGRASEDILSAKRDKNHILFGGTKILQHTPDKSFHLKTPDGGCLAVVLRTGFQTSQGKLMRTILFSTERVTANSWESGLFILFLVFFAIIAAGYVLKKGLEDPTRSKYKLFLSCSLIITSVIPPELPMELSIAVNTSLIALARRGIFCTEPFRIPFAGKVDICCFDKTGTLTSDDMEFQGVVCSTDGNLESDATKLPERTVEILAACHALVFVENKLVGDPLEKAALKGIDWIYNSDEKAMPKKSGGPAVQIVQRHHFASHLKRMAVVVRVQEEFLAFVKGAPETIQERLADLPSTYVGTYKKYTRQGSRVLALAYKKLPEMPVSEARSLDRDMVESDLTFAGFAVFNCPIRSDSSSVLKELNESSHDLAMITGDQALTACHVASQVHIISSPALILTPSKNGGCFEWVSPDETERIPFSEEEVESLSDSHDLCIGGDCFEKLQRTGAVIQVIPYVKVFARVAPEQKELIMTTFKSVGRMTLMCGDGTNDVGALKQAHVGIALLNAVPPGSSSQTSKGEAKSVKQKKTKLTVESSTKVGSSSTSVVTTSNRPLTAAEKQREKLKKMMDEMNEEADSHAPPIVKLGDASMASPFTAKHASVAPTLDIIRQGRSTLVTTLQMFKILGLNCLATAYVLSVMNLDGVKLGDVQATISGVFTAAFFLFISHARPLQTLSPDRPHPNIFCAYVLLSLVGQFAMHLVFLISAVNEASKHMPDECIEPDSDFHPNLVNTVSYMVNMMIQVATFAVNYMGRPFNQGISENKPFKYALLAAVGFFVVITSDVFRDLNDWLRLVPLPAGMRGKLLLWAALMYGGCYGWERLLRWAFPGKMPAWRSKQRKVVAAAAAQEKKDL